MSRASMADWWPRRFCTALTEQPRAKLRGVQVPEIVKCCPLGQAGRGGGAVPHRPGGVAAEGMADGVDEDQSGRPCP